MSECTHRCLWKCWATLLIHGCLSGLDRLALLRSGQPGHSAPRERIRELKITLCAFWGKWVNDCENKAKRQNKCEPKYWPLTNWQMTYGASSILRYWCINLPSLSQNWGDSASKGLPAFIADFFNAMSQRTSPEPRARGQAQFFLNCCEGKGVWLSI